MLTVKEKLQRGVRQVSKFLAFLMRRVICTHSLTEAKRSTQLFLCYILENAWEKKEDA